MENIPSVLIVSSSNTKPKSLIKLITKIVDIKSNSGIEGVINQPWTIDTKYYTANINLVGFEKDVNLTDKINMDGVEAFIIHMDTNRETGLGDLSKWEALDSDCSIDIKLLVCNYCTDETKISKNKALEWCIKRGFEFVELYPSDNSLDGEDDFKEKTGVERIIEALHSHTWSNLIMKSKNNSKQHLNFCEGVSSNFLETPSSVLTDPFANDMKDDFTELFSHLHMMKDSLQNMPMNQRKQCAEQMVTAFWKAIGGEEEELIDL